MTVALAGIVVMFADGLGAGHARRQPARARRTDRRGAERRAAAPISAQRVDMVPAVLLAGLFSIVVALPLAWPLTAKPARSRRARADGVRAARSGLRAHDAGDAPPAAGEIGLLALLETILGPIWVWIGIGERPTDSRSSAA